MHLDLSFHRATHDDAEPLVELINSAYRGESGKLGWTTEAHLVAGLRTDLNDLNKLLAEPNSLLLVCKQQETFLGSVHLRYIAPQVQIGMLAVSPYHQNYSIGKQLLKWAEAYAVQLWEVKRFIMYVIPNRVELIAFYERQAYIRTGLMVDFPENPRLWQPKVADLRLEVLEKTLIYRDSLVQESLLKS